MSGFEFDDHVASQLNRLFQTEALQKLRRDYFSLFNVQPNEHVLDIGCGTGANAVALAEFLQCQCRITGIDSSEPMLAIARHQLRNSPHEGRITYDSGDAHRLPYQDGTFDSAMMIQVLEYSSEPIALLRETMRVLKPGGKLLVVDTDWDTIVWNSSFKERTRRIVLLWSDHEADGWQGRKIREYLIRSEFDQIQGELFHISETSFTEDSYALQVTNLISDYLIRSEKMFPAEIQEWLEDLRAKDAADHFNFSLNRYAYVARASKKPPAAL